MFGQTQANVQVKYRSPGSNSSSVHRNRTAHSLQAFGEHVSGFGPSGQNVSAPPPQRRYALPLRSTKGQYQNISRDAEVPAPEHHLRRKTPAGTLDAAYDGSSSSRNSHADKHLIMHASATSAGKSAAIRQIPPLRNRNLTGPLLNHDPAARQMFVYPAAPATFYQCPPNQTLPYFEPSQPPQPPPYVQYESEQRPFFNSQDISHYPWHDQRIPNVAQPPLQRPLAQQHLPAHSNPGFGLYGFPGNGFSRLWDQHQPEVSVAQINQHILGLSLTDTTARQSNNQPLSNIVVQESTHHQNSVPRFYNSSNYPKAQSFSERVSAQSPQNPFPNQHPTTGHGPYMIHPRTGPWVGQRLEIAADSHPSASFPPPTTLPAQSQVLLSNAHTLYVSLVSAMQEVRKASLHNDPQSSRRYPQFTSIYPESIRKFVAQQGFPSNPGFDREYNGWPSGWPSTHPRAPSMPTPAKHLDLLDYAHLSGPSFDINPVYNILPPAYFQMQPSIGHDAPAPNYVPLHNSYGHLSPGSYHLPPNFPLSDNVSHLRGNAFNALGQLTILCREKSTPWLDGMLMAGCLAYVLGDYKCASQWFRLIIRHDASHIEATANLAATLLACNRRQEAEHYWRLAIQLQPRYFEGVEQLISLLCGNHRQREAVNVAEYVQKRLRIQPNVDSGSISNPRIPHESTRLEDTAKNRGLLDHDRSNAFNRTSNQPAFPTCQSNYYLGAESDQCRIMGLVHAKGNILYSLHDFAGAARAFEEVVMIATGFSTGCLKDLIGFIHAKLQGGIPPNSDSHREPLLLHPEKALLTATICFGPTGGLPGLSGVFSKPVRKATISVASNSLLSLAKIYQDGMSSNTDQSSKTLKLSNLNDSYGIQDILLLYYLSLSLQPSPSTANNVGILLASVQRPNSAPNHNRPKEQYKDQYWVSFPGVIAGSGTALALTYYQYGLSLDSKHAHLFTNLGSLLKDIGQLPMAIKMYERAVTCDGNFDIALANLANAIKDQGKTADAIIYYKRAVQVNPNFAEAVCGLASALNSVCSWVGRGGVILKDGSIDRWHVDENGSLVDSRTVGNQGSGWVQRVVDIVENQLIDGESWGRGVLQPRYVDLLMEWLDTSEPGPRNLSKQAHHSLRLLLKSWHHQKWEGARVIRFLERVVKLLGWTWYQDKYVRGNEAPLSTYHRLPLPSSLSNPSTPTVLPFHTFTFPMSARQIRLISQRNGLRVSWASLQSSWLPQTVYPPPLPPKPHLNIGYVSSDFNNHPLAHLMQSVFGMHDKSRFFAFCYATTANDKSSHRKQIEEEAHVFYDASSWPTENLVQQIIRDNIHILINLNGYTRGARNEVFAARPAPIQMSFMGFAGTLGAGWCDYLLADEIAVPSQTLRPYRSNISLRDLAYDEDSGSQNHDWVYSENIIYTRDTFFCCNHRQANASAATRTMTWPAELRRRWAMRKDLFPTLADDAIIFANFNQLYKIDPTTLRTWLRILSRCPRAVLWLLRFPDVGEHNLRATAVAWAGAAVASRIIFTDVAPKAVHIARACIADLFLDTPECNAHTTAADCLWSGTPLLTLPRYEWKMCSRMAASILGGALPRHTEVGRAAWEELVTAGEEEYEDSAVRLANGLQYTLAHVYAQATGPNHTHNKGGEADGASREEHAGTGTVGETATAGETSTGQGRGRLMDLREMIWSHRWESKLFDTRRWVRDLETAYAEAWRRWVAGEGGDIWLKDLPCLALPDE